MTPNEHLRSADPYRRVGTTLLNRYTLERYVNSGGMGVVYFALDLETKDPLAVKLLKPDLLSKNPEYATLFQREISSIQKFDHLNIVKIVDHGYTDDDNVPFMVMEWLEGDTLEEILSRQKFEIKRLRNLFEQICNAISYAHSHNVLHLDIKPANIFVITSKDDQEIIKVIDFGLAKILSSETGTTVTRLLGTLQYCSPEHFGGKFTFQTDVYSLGVTLYHMLTGLLPIGQSFIAAKQNPNREGPQLPSVVKSNPELPSSLDYVVQKATRKKPSERHTSVMLLWEEFEDTFDVSSQEEATTISLKKASNRPDYTLGLVLIILITLLATIFIFYTQLNTRSAQVDVLNSNTPSFINQKNLQTIAIIFFDISESVTASQRERNKDTLMNVIRALPSNSKFRVYPIDNNQDNSPIFVGEKVGSIMPDVSGLRSSLENIKTASSGSCIVATITTTKRAFRGYEDDEKYKRELIYISDMIENCSSSKYFDKSERTVNERLFENPEQFDCRPPLPQFNLTLIIFNSQYPRFGNSGKQLTFSDLENFWRVIFGKCFPDGQPLEAGKFYFDTVPPDKF